MFERLQVVLNAPLIQLTTLSAVLTYVANEDMFSITPLHVASVGVVAVAVLCVRSIIVRRKIRQLAEDAYWLARRHANQGCRLLIPKSGRDLETVCLRMRVAEDRILIDQVRWDEQTITCKTIRQYELSPTGQVTRRIIGCTMTELDERWCLASLSTSHLRYLIGAFEHTHQPVPFLVR